MELVGTKDHPSRLQAAKAALVTIMRTWVGIVQLTSDPLGLTILIRLLRDSKVWEDNSRMTGSDCIDPSVCAV